MTRTPTRSDTPGTSDDVDITAELARRASRAPEYAAEAAALGTLARTLAMNPRGLLQHVVETAMALCGTDSAGVSVLEPGGEHGVFRWHAAAGAFAANLHGTMPREASPCGDVIRRDQVLLLDRAERVYPAMRGLEPPIYESLLAPWTLDGAPVGTLWVIAHTPERHFDAEDARLLASLTPFAAAAWQTVLALEAAEAGRTAVTTELRQAQARAAALVAHLPGAAAFVVDHELRYLLAEGEALADAGLTPADLVGRTIGEALDTAAAAEHVPDFRRALAGEAFTREHAAYGRVYFTRGGPLRDTAGRVEAAVAVSTDITAYRNAEAALRASEARYRALAAASADVVYRMSPDWHEMHQLDGRGFLSDTPEPTDGWLGRYIYPDDRARVTAAIAEAVRTRSTFALEHRVMRADGTLGWTLSRAVPLLGPDGEVTEWIGTASDITDRREAEEGLRASEARLALELSRAEVLQRLSVRLVPEQRPESLHEEILDAAMALMGADAASLQLLEPGGERLRLVVSRHLHPVSAAYWRYVEASHASTCGQSFSTDDRVIVEDVEASAAMVGTRDLTEYRRSGLRAVQSTPLVSRSGRRLGLVSTHWRETRRLTAADFHCFDVLARQLADLLERADSEADLRASEAKYRTLFETMDEGVALCELVRDAGGRAVDYRFLELNRAFESHMGLTHADAQGRLRGEVLPPSDQSWVDLYERVVADGASVHVEHFSPALGQWFDVRALPRDGDRFAVLFSNITARKEAEAALRASEARYRMLFESIDEGFCVVEVLFAGDDAERAIDYRFLEANPAFVHQTGLEDAVGRTMRELVPAHESHWFEIYGRVARTGEPTRFEGPAEALGRWYDVYAFRVGEPHERRVAILFADIAPRKRAEAALKASEERQAFLLKLSDAVGPLADPEAVAAAACRLLCEHLEVHRVNYADIEGDEYIIRSSHARGVAPITGRGPIATYPHAMLAEYRRAGAIAVDDVAADPRFGERERASYARAEVAATASVMLVKAGRWVASFAAHSATPRRWTALELTLVRETAERVWEAVERARAEAAMRASEEHNRGIVEAARDYAIFTIDAHETIDSWSPGAETVLGWTAGEAVGQPFETTFVAEDRARGEPAHELAVARERGVAPDVRWHARKDGGRVFLEGTTRALRDDAGTLHGYLKVGQDVTARRRLDEALHASEVRYRTLVDNIRDYAIFGLDAAGVVITWTAGAERVKGYRPDQVVGRHLALFYTPEDVAAGVPAQHLAEAAATGRGEWEGWRVRKDGTRFWANEIATAVRDDAGRLVGFTKISRDLTERRLGEQAAEQAQLAAARDELRRALAEAEEAERRRLARELHDQLGQELTAFRLGLDDAARLASGHVPAGAPGRDALLGRLAQLGALAARMTTGARYLALELRPPELDDLGLESALATYVTEWGARYGVAADVAVTGALRDRALSAEVGSTLYRIVQEALTNVAKHAAASQVSVIVEKPDGEVRLIVEDNGRGFDVEATTARAQAARRLGLAGMRERAALVGGTIAVESGPGAGTTLYVRLPVRDAPDAPVMHVAPDAASAAAGEA